MFELPGNPVEPTRNYEHSAAVKAQIADLPAFGTAAFWAHIDVSSDTDSKDALNVETLVYCLRQVLASGDVMSAQRIAEHILERCARTVLRQAWRWFPASADDRDDMRQEVHAKLWDELSNPRERFWEIRFFHALKCLCFDVAKRMKRPADFEEPWGHHFDDDGEHIEIDIADPDSISPDERLFVEQALGRLDEPVRTAVYLRFIEGWKIHGQNPDEMTISRILNVTDRSVRNYLKHGLTTLHDWYVKEIGHGISE